MITLTGMSRFRVQREVEGFTPYRRCDVSLGRLRARLGPTETTHLSTATRSAPAGRFFDRRAA
jgi:Lon protease-like protein